MPLDPKRCQIVVHLQFQVSFFIYLFFKIFSSNRFLPFPLQVVVPHGEPVTVETFLAWRERFEAELALERAK